MDGWFPVYFTRVSPHFSCLTLRIMYCLSMRSKPAFLIRKVQLLKSRNRTLHNRIHSLDSSASVQCDGWATSCGSSAMKMGKSIARLAKPCAKSWRGSSLQIDLANPVRLFTSRATSLRAGIKEDIHGVQHAYTMRMAFGSAGIAPLFLELIRVQYLIGLHIQCQAGCLFICV